MQEPPTWRDLLGSIIQDPHEKQRIANELGVNPLTLMRWAHNEATPRQQNLQLLLRALPKHQAVLRELILEEFSPAAAAVSTVDLSQAIPSEFYARVLDAYSTASQSQRFWSISNLVLLQALGQLDPNQTGMAITIAQCMPPPVGAKKIRSLREHVGRGTAPWNTNLDQQVMFLGTESLAGYAVASGRILTIQDRTERPAWLPAHWVAWERSAAACPILRESRVAGCLLVSSTQPHYFLPFRERLIQNYAKLIVLAFEPDEFYELQDIELRLMPPYHLQESHLTGFRKRVIALLVEATRNQLALTYMQAEQLAWQQLEEELLQLPPYTQGSVPPS
jgi:hypothetical protein